MSLCALNIKNRLLPSGQCSVQRCWASCRWPTGGSPLPGWFGPSPRHSSSPGLWWRWSPPGLCPFYTQTSPESSSRGRCQCSAALWCSLCWESCQNFSEPTERGHDTDTDQCFYSCKASHFKLVFVSKIYVILTPVCRIMRDVLEPSVHRIPAISTAI